MVFSAAFALATAASVPAFAQPEADAETADTAVEAPAASDDATEAEAEPEDAAGETGAPEEKVAQAEPDAAGSAPPAEPEVTDEVEAEDERPDDGAGETSGWFRIDTDVLETQFWVGATHDLGPVALASDIYVVGSFAELDLGPSFSIGDLALTPMVGIGFDFSTKEFASLIAPQLFTIFDHDKVYVESWIQVFFNSIFDDDDPMTPPLEDTFYTRNFVLYKVLDQLHIGPQVEVSYQFNEDEAAMLEKGLTSLPIGGRVNVEYGKNNTLGLFLGYDIEDGTGDNVAGRFTFVRTW